MPQQKTNDEFTFYGLIGSTLIDYPGLIASTVFTLGCNFRCPYCQNRELALSVKDTLSEYPASLVLQHTARDNNAWIDGICITGGEPLLSDKIETAIRKFKAAGLKVKVDTNGGFPKRLSALIDKDMIDYVAMDVKAPFTEEEYSKATGVPAERWLPAVRESVEILKAARIETEFRTTCVPGLHTPEAIERLARDIAPCRMYSLQKFRPHNTLDPSYEQVPEPKPQEMEELLEAARQHVPAAQLR